MKKTEEKIKNKSLIGSTAEETQSNEVTFRNVIRAVLVILLFSVMIFSFFCVFSKHNFLIAGDYKYVGALKSEKYYDTKTFDLLKIKTQNNISQISTNDVVFYSTNIESGSGKFVSSYKNIVTLETDEGKTFTINAASIVGVEVQKVGIVGIFVWYLTSLTGALVTAAVLLAYVLYLTFSRVNYENTEHGKYLLSEYKKWKKELKNQRKLKELFIQVDGVDQTCIEILKGNFDENAAKFEEFNPQLKVSAQEKYKFILFNVHENLIEKQYLNMQEKRVVSSIIELLGKARHIDSDIEYMIVDLALKCKLVAFETDKFIDCSQEFFCGDIDKDDLLNFGSIFYILVKRNSVVFRGKAKKLAMLYVKKAGEFGDNTAKMAKNIMTSMIKI